MSPRLRWVISGYNLGYFSRVGEGGSEEEAYCAEGEAEAEKQQVVVEELLHGGIHRGGRGRAGRGRAAATW